MNKSDWNLKNRLEVFDLRKLINKERKSMVTKLEIFLLKYLGQAIMSFSVAGIVLAAIFDKLTRGLWQTLGWAQIVGIIAFGCMYVVGMAIQELHKRLLILVKREEGN